MTTVFADHLLGPNTHANRPAATAVPSGTLYSCSDHGLIYQSDGATWSTWATLGGAGGGMLASTIYDPATKVDASISSGTFADVDATNLAVAFTVPASGKVLVRLNGYAAAGANGISWGLREGTTNLDDRLVRYQDEGGSSATFVISGLTPDAAKTYKWSHARTVGSTTVITQYGGIQGAAVMEVWAAA